MISIKKTLNKLAVNKIDKNKIIINTVDISFSNGYGIYYNSNIHTNSKIMVTLADQTASTSIIVAPFKPAEGNVELTAFNADATHHAHTGDKTCNIFIYNGGGLKLIEFLKSHFHKEVA